MPPTEGVNGFESSCLGFGLESTGGRIGHSGLEFGQLRYPRDNCLADLGRPATPSIQSNRVQMNRLSEFR